MITDVKQYSSTAELLANNRPVQPVYCIHPSIYQQTAEDFVREFPGRVLYAAKANDHPLVIQALYRGGVRHFDCASLPEIARVKTVCPDAFCYFMTPVRLRGAARQAQQEHGVRHFLVDHRSGLNDLANEIEISPSLVIFARMAVHHTAAAQDLSVRFGAPPQDIPELLTSIRKTGAEPALAFNVGSNVSQSEAYRYAIGVASETLGKLDFKVRLVDIGGGFPKPYPGFEVPPLAEYFQTVQEACEELPLLEDSEVMVEPGRALAASGMSAIVEVLLRKERRLFLNDGMYGIFWELRFKGHDRYPVRCFRDGQPLLGNTQKFSLFGPTCDSSDSLPGQVGLPSEIKPGDYLEFGSIGAYSFTGRTNFNGHLSNNVVVISAD